MSQASYAAGEMPSRFCSPAVTEPSFRLRERLVLRPKTTAGPPYLIGDCLRYGLLAIVRPPLLLSPQRRHQRPLLAPCERNASIAAFWHHGDLQIGRHFHHVSS